MEYLICSQEIPEKKFGLGGQEITKIMPTHLNMATHLESTFKLIYMLVLLHYNNYDNNCWQYHNRKIKVQSL